VFLFVSRQKGIKDKYHSGRCNKGFEKVDSAKSEMLKQVQHDSGEGEQ
jgi:hypothetical protein